jgi:hypothetical protein
VLQGCAQKEWEELEANREDEQQRVAECLDLSVGLGEGKSHHDRVGP